MFVMLSGISSWLILPCNRRCSRYVNKRADPSYYIRIRFRISPHGRGLAEFALDILDTSGKLILSDEGDDVGDSKAA